ncbi:uroporphyrinogen-III synthase [Aestuariibacter halophilus]|uniref:Uroporphyrinogen-III synthase n=1 Tax=Fluctibacter halophilus TaxID=226011 RepID=A0ABS8GAT0_9ALTE|nr:uroporphyrinogen-III synthase [Aestuariibacter halophilus]MCC2617539.1 uroporphyrinogen-III synthase [Aestuariibacter halophilus]
MTVLVLRPRHKVDASVAFFQQQGIAALGWGLIETLPDDGGIRHARHQLAKVDDQHGIIVTSTVAAHASASFLAATLATVFAIGKSTAAVLDNLGIQAHTPEVETSEGMLALIDSLALECQHWFILKGVGGRDALATGLQQRGNKVEELAVYQRHVMAKPYQTQPWQWSEIQCIVATSGALIDAAFHHTPASVLQSIPWAVVSERLAGHLERRGVTDVRVCNGASDAALVACIRNKME